MADTSIEHDILACRLRACAERRNGNHRDGDAWDAEADALETRLVLLQQRAEWDSLADNRHE